MKKISTEGAAGKRNFEQKVTIGLDLGDRSSWYSVRHLRQGLASCIPRKLHCHSDIRQHSSRAPPYSF